jgi:hypothetical protein
MSHNEQPKTSLSRRSVIMKGAGLAAAGVVAATAAPIAFAELTDASSTAGRAVAEPTVPVMLQLRDVEAGNFDVFVGTRLVEISDPAFAARLAEIANA